MKIDSIIPDYRGKKTDVRKSYSVTAATTVLAKTVVNAYEKESDERWILKCTETSNGTPIGRRTGPRTVARRCLDGRQKIY